MIEFIKIKKVQEVEVVDKALVTCDVCKKQFADLQNDENVHYYSVLIGHDDWGNDSFESREYLDICSNACLCKEFNDFVNKTGRYEPGINSYYFEISPNRKVRY